MDRTRVGVIGSGQVGRGPAQGFASRGHEVRIGTRDENPDLQAWAGAEGAGVEVGSFPDVAEFAEIVVLATLGVANEEALQRCGHDNLARKIVIDVTNPLVFGDGPPRLAV